jgi:hypothetical protein
VSAITPMRSAHVAITLACAALAGTPALLAAQQAAPLAAGTMVRWMDPPSGGRHVEGVVTAATADSLFVQTVNGPAYRIAAASNPSLMVRGDRRSRIHKALAGAAIGAGAGLIIGVATRESGCDAYFGCGYESDGRYVGASILGGAIWGGLIGLLLTPGWQWHALESSGARVSVRPFGAWHDGPAVGLQITNKR